MFLIVSIDRSQLLRTAFGASVESLECSGSTMAARREICFLAWQRGSSDSSNRELISLRKRYSLYPLMWAQISQVPLCLPDVTK